MADLVPGDRLDLVERRAFERDVGDGDARRMTEPRDIGGEIVRLARAVEDEDAPGLDARLLRLHFERVAHRAGGERFILVEQ